MTRTLLQTASSRVMRERVTRYAQEECLDALILAARADAPEAFEELLYRFRSRLQMLVRKYFGHGVERDDFVQEAYIGFAKAVRDYKAEKSTFGTFVDLCVHRQLITFVHKTQRKKHAYFNQAFSLDGPPPGSQGDATSTLHDRIGVPASFEWLDAQTKDEFIAILRERCSATEESVLNGYCEGYSYAELAAQCGIRCKSVDNALVRVKKKAQKILLEKPHLAESFGAFPQRSPQA